MTQRFHVPFGEDTLAFSLPEGWAADVAASPEALPPLAEPRPAFDYGPAIREARQVVITFTDATRHSPDQWLAEQILAELRRHDFPEERVSFLCAVGMHRPSTEAEKVAKLGAAIVERFPVLDHDQAGVVTLGDVDGVPVQVNPLLVEPGTLVVALGVVEPHQYAGFSGGAKTAVIGCGGAETIGATHGPRFLDQPGTRLANVVDNPFQAFVRAAGQMIGLRWVYNVVLNSRYEVVDAYQGPPEVVHDTLIARARQLYEVAVPAPYDLVVAGVGAPKDANLYQASRAATYIGLSHRPVIRPGGVIILPAPLPEGAGQGAGERNFIAVLERWPDLNAMMADMHRNGCLPGEQRAYMVAQMLAQYRVIVVGAGDAQVVQAAHLTPAASMDEAFALAVQWVGDRPHMLVVPHALQTIPVPDAPAD